MGKRGCDHGLGGRDNEKSRQRRAKKASATKKIALASLKGGPKKREVIFDEESRVEFLTGFQKRKQERRKYGLTKQVEKEKKLHKEEVKSHRQAVREVRAEGGQTLDKIRNELREGEQLRTAAMGKEMMFQDDQTKAMFGDAVMVVVDTAGLADQLDLHSFPADHAPTGKTSNTFGRNNEGGVGGRGGSFHKNSKGVVKGRQIVSKGEKGQSRTGKVHTAGARRDKG